MEGPPSAHSGGRTPRIIASCRAWRKGESCLSQSWGDWHRREAKGGASTSVWSWSCGPPARPGDARAGEVLDSLDREKRHYYEEYSSRQAEPPVDPGTSSVSSRRRGAGRFGKSG